MQPHELDALEKLRDKDGEWFDSDYWFVRKMLPELLTTVPKARVYQAPSCLLKKCDSEWACFPEGVCRHAKLEGKR